MRKALWRRLQHCANSSHLSCCSLVWQKQVAYKLDHFYACTKQHLFCAPRIWQKLHNHPSKPKPNPNFERNVLLQPWRAGAIVFLKAWRQAGRWEKEAVFPPVSQKSGSNLGNGDPLQSQSIGLLLFFSSYRKTVFSFFTVSNTSANVPPCCLYSPAFWHGTHVGQKNMWNSQ